VAATLQTGIYVFPNGDKYEGEYRMSADGVIERHGRGVYISFDGTTYSGDWISDALSGQARIVYPSGAVYEGSISGNSYNGLGKYSWPDGSSVSGIFKDMKLDGHGEFMDSSGKVWKGLFHGRSAPGLRVKQA
jgi:hypothetical protein